MACPEADIGLDAGDAFEGEALAIEVTYRRMVAGLGHLSRHDRAAALKTARAQRQGAMKALRDRQASARRAQRLTRRWQLPPPP